MRIPSARSLTVFALAGSAAIGAAVLVLGAVGVFAFLDAVQLTVSIAALGVLAAILVGQRRVDGKVQRLTRSHRKYADSALALTREAETELRDRIRNLGHQVSEVSASLGEDRIMFAIHSGLISKGLAGVEDRMSSMASELSRDVAELRPRLDRLSAGLQELERAGEVSYKQLEAYVDLRGIVRPRAPMPGLRGWAASPDVVRFLVENLWVRRPKLIVECGSGSSSIWLGYIAEQIGSATVVALEHDERYAEISRDLVQAHGLADVVDIRHAPLADWKDGKTAYLWYGREAIEDLAGIGLLFIDGPPRNTCPSARYPAIPLLLPRCSQDAVIVLDDSHRDEEREISDRWMAAHPELQRAVRHFDKGAHVFTRRTT